ncbi:MULTISPECIES: hypothetical protein [Streptomyces]|uniref:hypothetical protein n=1 Tax=Streptomyces TaxID=1883 RepID=UPI0012FEA5E0|nr:MULTISPECIES: hypothetical protein [Streptomyces]
MTEKHASPVTRPERNGWSTATPVSRTATVVPAPVFPAAKVPALPIVRADSSRVGATGTSSETLTTFGSVFSC